MTITLRPAGHCVNPVLELKDAPKTLQADLAQRSLLPADRYRWDGATLWLDLNLDRGNVATGILEF